MNTRWVLLLTLVWLVSCTSNSGAAFHTRRRLSRGQWARIQREIDRSVFVIQPMNLGCTLPDVQVQVAVRGMLGFPVEAFEQLRVVRNGKGIFAGQLNDLRGYVHISDPETALRYVRLYTAPETWFFWRRGQWEAEVMAADPARRLPNFGLNRELDFGTLGDGHFGVLSPELFRRRGFTPASAGPLEDGFVIDRWLLVEDSRWHLSVQHVRETVRPDGRYQRQVLETRPAEGMHLPRYE